MSLMHYWVTDDEEVIRHKQTDEFLAVQQHQERHYQGKKLRYIGQFDPLQAKCGDGAMQKIIREGSKGNVCKKTVS